MRARTSEPWRVPRRAGAWVAQEWRAAHLARRVLAWVENAPVSQVVGVAYLLAAVPALVILLVVRQLVPDQAYLIAEMCTVMAIGALLAVARRAMAYLARRRR